MTPARALTTLVAFAAVLGLALPAAAQTTLRINIALGFKSVRPQTSKNGTISSMTLNRRRKLWFEKRRKR